MYLINPNHLKHYRYHWLWGVQPTTNQQQSIASAIKGWPMAEISLQLRQMAGKWWWQRTFYWLFNINQYRSHYQLHPFAVASDLFNREYKKMMHEHNHDTDQSHLISTMLLAIGSIAASYLAANYGAPALQALSRLSTSVMQRLGLSETETQVAAFVPPANNTNSALVTLSQPQAAPTPKFSPSLKPSKPKASSEPSFVIWASMLDYLYTLGLEAEQGTNTITVDQLKKAYKKAARQNHPDKGGNEEDFKRVNEAYHQLERQRKLSAQALAMEPPSTIISSYLYPPYNRPVTAFELQLCYSDNTRSERRLQRAINRYIRISDKHLQKTRSYQQACLNLQQSIKTCPEDYDAVFDLKSELNLLHSFNQILLDSCHETLQMWLKHWQMNEKSHFKTDPSALVYHATCAYDHAKHEMAAIIKLVEANHHFLEKLKKDNPKFVEQQEVINEESDSDFYPSF